MVRSMQLSIIRRISLSLPPTATTGTAATTTRQHNLHDVHQLTPVPTLDTTEFRAVGSPPSVLSVHLPPSIPVYVRRGALLSIYGVDDSANVGAVRSTLEYVAASKRLLYGGYASGYQKLVSTTPFSLLVSSVSRNLLPFFSSGDKSFVNISLDGTTDWAVLNKHALQTYAGNSLGVAMHRSPRTVSRKLAKQLGVAASTPTGLFRWLQAGYTLLSGRGQVALVGHGAVYNINVAEGQELLVNRRNLVGITVNGPHDLQNCIVKYSFPMAEAPAPAPPASVSLRRIVTLDGTLVQKLRLAWQWTQHWMARAAGVLHRGRRDTYNFLVGNTEFVRVIGPRTLLLQSSTGSAHVATAYSPSVQHQREVAPTSADYLSYVTVKPDGVKFESTPDFRALLKQPSQDGQH